MEVGSAFCGLIFGHDLEVTDAGPIVNYVGCWELLGKFIGFLRDWSRERWGRFMMVERREGEGESGVMSKSSGAANGQLQLGLGAPG